MKKIILPILILAVVVISGCGQEVEAKNVWVETTIKLDNPKDGPCATICSNFLMLGYQKCLRQCKKNIIIPRRPDCVWPVPFINKVTLEVQFKCVSF